jgi:putative DNA methylase
LITKTVKSPRKLIEVALPLDAINAAAAREKSIRHGHPSTLHLWWARRPLAAARAVIFGQMVNDPSWKWEMDHPGEVPPGNLKASWAASRKRLFTIIEDLVKWENTTNEEVLDRARAEIRKSWRETCEINKNHPQADELFNPDKLPALHDPFAGGGSIPLEAQRLGLEAYASDLNPVAVLINKAMIEIPPKFAGNAPVGPLTADDGNSELDLPNEWPGSTGLAEDVHRYGAWMRAKARQRLGHLYPRVEITMEMARERSDLQHLVGQRLIVIAWLWARTVKSPNPAFSHVLVPLASTFILSNKADNGAYVQPVVEGDEYRFTVKSGGAPTKAKDGTRLARGANFRCLVSNTAMDQQHIRGEFVAKRAGQRLMAVVVEGPKGRVYLAPTPDMEVVARSAEPAWRPEATMNQESKDLLSGRGYGFHYWCELFTSRQLAMLTTFSDLVAEAREEIRHDALAAGMDDSNIGIAAGGMGATAYAEAVSVYLALAISRFADRNNALCTWDSGPIGAKSSTGGSARTASLRGLFSRQAIPMAWDFGEANPFSNSGGGYNSAFEWLEPAIRGLYAKGIGHANQADAQTQSISDRKVISTDPPYYDNIGYADLSDFFYIWLRRSLRSTYPQLLATIAVPKAEELVATPYRHGTKEKAESFFLKGMTQAMTRLAHQAHPSMPITIYYAFKQAETRAESGTSSSGWETFLEAVHKAGLQLSGTWPMRTELANRMVGEGNNALASSIVLVCRVRSAAAPTISRREFLRELNAVLPEALDEMTKGSGDDRSPVAPVDLSQAIIGPGMAVFSKYAGVLEADGTPMSVRTALQLINRFLAEDDFDPDTQFSLHWFEQHAWSEGAYGDADTLSRGKGTSVDGMKGAGILHSGGGKVRLLKWAEYPSDWDPKTDARLPVWEALHQLIRALKQGGEPASGGLLAALGGKAEAVRQLSYRLYTLCERLGQSEDARAYNEIVTSWSAIEAAAARVVGPQQADLFDA